MTTAAAAAAPPPPATEPAFGRRPAETGGAALQLDLAAVLPGETDDKGRFEKLERAIESRNGVTDVHLRRDGPRPEICIHYDEERVEPKTVLAIAHWAGGDVRSRYIHKTWFVRGMDCAQCGFVIEHAVSRSRGVLSASVAYASERLVLEYDREAASLRDIEARVRALGYELEEPAQGHACCAHGHGGGLAPRLEIPLALGSGALLAAGYGLSKLAPGLPPAVPTALYALAMASGGLFAARNAWNAIKQARLDIDTLMVVAAAAAAILGAWMEGALLLFLFSLGHALEHRAMERARRAIEALGKLRPETARIRREGQFVEVRVEEVKRGDRIFVRAGDRVPLDGTIRDGKTSLDQATVTGESVPVAKGPGDPVFAGTINAEAAIEVEVTKLSTESAIARVIDMVSEAEAQKSPTQRFTQRLERRFVPLVLLAAPALAGILILRGTPAADALLRACSMLVAASPCALAISTPSAVLSAVARAARGGVLMKGGAHLESLGRVAVMAFDKTGTLTVGKPKLVSATPLGGATEQELLRTAAGAEALSPHPLARAVVEGARERKIEPAPAQGCEAIHGKGIRSTVEGEPVGIGNLAFFEGEDVPAAVKDEVARLETAGQSTMIVKRGARFLGVVGVADTLRAEAKDALAALRAIGIRRTVMLSGDNIRVARAIGAEVGIDEPRAPLLPEGKVAALREMSKEGGVAMVGDGVNDAPALAAASVGVSMGGAGSDVALETADVVLMSDDLRRLPFAVGLARQATRIIRQNLVVSLGVSALLVIASIFGWVRIGEAVVLHEGSTLLVVANALRLLGYRG